MWMTSVSMTADGVKHYIAEDGDEHDRTQVPKVVDHNVSASKHFDIVRSRIVGRRTVEMLISCALMVCAVSVCVLRDYVDDPLTVAARVDKCQRVNLGHQSAVVSGDTLLSEHRLHRTTDV